jgi:hypothetical protein
VGFWGFLGLTKAATSGILGRIRCRRPGAKPHHGKFDFPIPDWEFRAGDFEHPASVVEKEFSDDEPLQPPAFQTFAPSMVTPPGLGGGSADLGLHGRRVLG